MAKREVMLQHLQEVELPVDAKEVHFLLACSVIRDQMYATGKIARQSTFFMTADSVYARMADSFLYYQVKLSLV